MPGSVSAQDYKNIAERQLYTKLVAEDTMNTAADELVNKSTTVSDNEGLPFNISVSGDGSWHLRSFTSLNGFVSMISMNNGMIIDIEAISKSVWPLTNSRNMIQ